MYEQSAVAAFIDRHGLHCPPEYRVLDLAAEVGEIASDAAKSTDYGANQDEMAIKEDEIGDALFALLAVAHSVDVDAGEALETALQKYERRIEEDGSAGSGNY